ncbi:unnamed protein product [Caenorhabditis angaria]|uniref:Uncharacterized protein n=1 Tax=Caenorhabditis angaria TaxID=860376 RepID=A0A9P1I854_9PELO|nr:unnamed protein product [Caenorhabditis angaria]
MGDIFEDWSVELLQAVVGKLIHRNKIPESFKNLEPGDLTNETAIIDRLNLLFEDDKNEMLQIYGNAHEMMFEINNYLRFSNISQFFGFQEGRFNGRIEQAFDKKGRPLLSKGDAMTWLSKHYEPNPFVRLITYSIIDKVLRKLKQQNMHFDMIPLIIFDHKYAQLRNTRVKRKISNFPPEFTVDRFFGLFDEKYDAEIIEYLKQAPPNEICPKNYLDMHFWKADLEKLFLDKSADQWFYFKYPCVQILEEDGQKYFIAKELENALEAVMRVKYYREFPKGLITIETEEDLEIGILRTVNYDTFLKILKILKLSTDELNYYDREHIETSLNISPPINSPYGTFCKSARHAFEEVFDELNIGMRLFRGTKPANLPDLIDWFEEHCDEDEVFGADRKYRYMIETWKIEELKNWAHGSLQKYITEPIYEIPRYREYFNDYEVLQELDRISKNWNTTELRAQIAIQLEVKMKNEWIYTHCTTIYKMYHDAVFNMFISKSSMILDFLENQGMEKVANLRQINCTKLENVSENLVEMMGKLEI